MLLFLFCNLDIAWVYCCILCDRNYCNDNIWTFHHRFRSTLFCFHLFEFLFRNSHRNCFFDHWCWIWSLFDGKWDMFLSFLSLLCFFCCWIYVIITCKSYLFYEFAVDFFLWFDYVWLHHRNVLFLCRILILFGFVLYIHGHQRVCLFCIKVNAFCLSFLEFC